MVNILLIICASISAAYVAYSIGYDDGVEFGFKLGQKFKTDDFEKILNFIR